MKSIVSGAFGTQELYNQHLSARIELLKMTTKAPWITKPIRWAFYTSREGLSEVYTPWFLLRFNFGEFDYVDYHSWWGITLDRRPHAWPSIINWKFWRLPRVPRYEEFER